MSGAPPLDQRTRHVLAGRQPPFPPSLRAQAEHFLAFTSIACTLIFTGGSPADVSLPKLHRQVVAVEMGHVHGDATVGIGELRIRPEGQQHSAGMHSQRLLALQGAVVLDVDRVRAGQLS